MSHIAEKYVNEYVDRYNMDKEQLYLLYSLGLEDSIKFSMEELIKEKALKKLHGFKRGL